MRNKEEPRTIEPRTVNTTAVVEKSAWESLHPGILERLRNELEVIADTVQGENRCGWSVERLANRERELILLAAKRARVWPHIAERLGEESYRAALQREGDRGVA